MYSREGVAYTVLEIVTNFGSRPVSICLWRDLYSKFCGKIARGDIILLRGSPKLLMKKKDKRLNIHASLEDGIVIIGRCENRNENRNGKVNKGKVNKKVCRKRKKCNVKVGRSQKKKDEKGKVNKKVCTKRKKCNVKVGRSQKKKDEKRIGGFKGKVKVGLQEKECMMDGTGSMTEKSCGFCGFNILAGDGSSLYGDISPYEFDDSKSVRNDNTKMRASERGEGVEDGEDGEDRKNNERFVGFDGFDITAIGNKSMYSF